MIYVYSVFGGYFDAEFEEKTKIFFKQIINKGVKILYSELTKNELVNAPDQVKDFVNALPEYLIEYIEIVNEALDLADVYIKENVVGKTSREDCIHIALATIFRADVLVSWNFKHIVNLSRIRGYNSVNLRTGFPSIEIRSPLELIEYEENN
ncbi:MAG: PIN domain protein [Bacteroidia bacterium]|nr:PIN domain protein [Bacteroidia bacterium]